MVGNGGWWFWIGIPVYSAYALYAGVMTAKQGFAGMGGAGAGGGESKRQKKMEKRGAKVSYR
jgi:hypothetical protein